MLLLLRCMKKSCVIALLMATGLAAGQENTFTLDDVMQSAREWAVENLDEDALRSLGEADQEKVRQFLAEAQKKFQGEYVIDLAALGDIAKGIVPLLESHEETLPYAVWLKARMDYFEVAGELRLRIPPPVTDPGVPAPPRTNPAPETQRDIWIEKVAKRPWPSRAESYVKTLKPVFVRHRVPAELVWIAEVESSFDPRARSPAGAVGLFQLMPDTARQYGLRTTWPLDQRLKPEESAGAAARHLARLHGRFKDWRLVLASYNAGEGAVQRLLDRSKTKTYNAIAARLPAETQMYVPKVEATLLRREGVRLASLKLPAGQQP